MQEIEKVLLPADEIETASEPEADVWVVQLAEQEVALVEDQVKVEVLSSRTETGSAERLTVGAGVVGVTGEALPPPPPPPQEDIKNISGSKNENLFIFKKKFINM